MESSPDQSAGMTEEAIQKALDPTHGGVLEIRVPREVCSELLRDDSITIMPLDFRIRLRRVVEMFDNPSPNNHGPQVVVSGYWEWIGLVEAAEKCRAHFTHLASADPAQRDRWHQARTQAFNFRENLISKGKHFLMEVGVEKPSTLDAIFHCKPVIDRAREETRIERTIVIPECLIELAYAKAGLVEPRGTVYAQKDVWARLVRIDQLETGKGTRRLDWAGWIRVDRQKGKDMLLTLLKAVRAHKDERGDAEKIPQHVKLALWRFHKALDKALNNSFRTAEIDDEQRMPTHLPPPQTRLFQITCSECGAVGAQDRLGDFPSRAAKQMVERRARDEKDFRRVRSRWLCAPCRKTEKDTKL